MKKKIIGITIAGLLVLSGIVSAASLWGTYKGNDIIRLTVGGNPVKIKANDVPAFSFNNRTMIPINLLQQAGITYTYDQKTKTVNILNGVYTVPMSNSVENNIDPSEIAKDIISKGGGGVTLTNINNELTAVVYFNRKTNINDDWLTIQKILFDLIDYNALWSRVVYVDGSTTVRYIEVKTQYLKNFQDGIITSDQLKGYTTWSGFNNTNTSSSGGGIVDTPITTTTVVSKIDGDFDGFEEGKIFQLQNGQIWKQTSYEYKYAYKYSPKVTIYKDGAYWYMVVDGVDKQVKVERIK